MKEVLVSFKHHGSYGGIHGIYIVSLEDWNKIKLLQEEGEMLYLGDAMGKHSDVTLSADNFTFVTDSKEEVNLFRNLFGETFGSYEPFDSAMEIYGSITYEEEEEL